MIQALKKAIKRIKNNKELWEGCGNRETVKKTFFSKYSILLWTLTNYKKINQRYSYLFNSNEYDHIHFIRLKTKKDKEIFLRNLEAKVG